MSVKSETENDRPSHHLAAKLGGFFRVGDQVADMVDDLCREKVTFRPRHRIVGAGDAYGSIYLIQSGWVLRASHLQDGRRQIVNIALAGDLLCFNASLFKKSTFDLIARTNVEAYRFDIPRVMDMLASQSKLALALSWANAQEESLLAERIVSLGRRSACEKVAHIFCEILERLRIVSLYDQGPLRMPLSQEDLADILGMSLIHTNRTIRGLVRAKLLRYRAGEVVILDETALRGVAGFEDDYLHFTRQTDGVFV